MLKETFQLYNGVNIPKVGFGTWQVPNGDIAYQAVKDALEVGYIHIDTAYVYENEVSVGQAIKDAHIKRSELFVTSKLPSHIKTYDETESYFHETLKRLQLDYLDLYLIHAPWPWSNIGQDCKEGNAEAWKKMVELYESKKIRAIGVSNFNVDDLKDLIARTGVVPHVNQIAFFAGHFQKQKQTIAFCQDNHILVEAYSPLAIGHALKIPLVVSLAEKYQRTPAQILIRYTLEHNTLPLPKSTKKVRMEENADLDFSISKEDVLLLDQLSEDPRRFG
ncbi:MAG: aldo/keto reductase [Acholeplasmataceae bacterium]|jgi:diketogulonate reductase-like aldo/keto reductase